MKTVNTPNPMATAKSIRMESQLCMCSLEAARPSTAHPRTAPRRPGGPLVKRFANPALIMLAGSVRGSQRNREHNRRMRLGWFTPLRPVTSGIADYSADVLPAIAAGHQVDVFVASRPRSAARRRRRGVADPRRARVSLARPPWSALRPGRLPARQRLVPRLHVAVPVRVPGPGRPARRAPAPRARVVACSGGAVQSRTTATSSSSTIPPPLPGAAAIGLGGYAGSIYYAVATCSARSSPRRAAIAVHNATVGWRSCAAIGPRRRSRRSRSA